MTPREQFENLVGGFAEGTLDAEAQAQFDALIAGHPEWLEEAEGERALVATLRAMGNRRAPAGLATAVMAEIHDRSEAVDEDMDDASADIHPDEDDNVVSIEPPRRRREHRPIFTYGAAAIVMVGAVVSYLTSDRTARESTPLAMAPQSELPAYYSESGVVVGTATRGGGVPEMRALSGEPTADAVLELEDAIQETRVARAVTASAPPRTLGRRASDDSTASVAVAPAAQQDTRVYMDSVASGERRARAVDPAVDAVAFAVLPEERFAAMSQRGSEGPPSVPRQEAKIYGDVGSAEVLANRDAALFMNADLGGQVVADLPDDAIENWRRMEVLVAKEGGQQDRLLLNYLFAESDDFTGVSAAAEELHQVPPRIHERAALASAPSRPQAKMAAAASSPMADTDTAATAAPRPLPPTLEEWVRLQGGRYEVRDARTTRLAYSDQTKAMAALATMLDPRFLENYSLHHRQLELRATEEGPSYILINALPPADPNVED